MRIPTTVALTALVVGLLAGCASNDPTPPATDPGTDTGAGAGTELQLGFGQAEGDRVTAIEPGWTVTCDPVGGTHPDAEAVCALLEAEGVALFEPVPGDAMCTEIYGGPEVATVTGTVAGERVDATFTRTNGCEIDRWDAAAVLIGGPGF